MSKTAESKKFNINMANSLRETDSKHVKCNYLSRWCRTADLLVEVIEEDVVLAREVGLLGCLSIDPSPTPQPHFR